MFSSCLLFEYFHNFLHKLQENNHNIFNKKKKNLDSFWEVTRWLVTWRPTLNVQKSSLDDMPKKKKKKSFVILVYQINFSGSLNITDGAISFHCNGDLFSDKIYSTLQTFVILRVLYSKSVSTQLKLALSYTVIFFSGI